MLVKILRWALKQRSPHTPVPPERSPIASAPDPTPSDLVEAAFRHAQDGDLVLAEQMLTQAIALDPARADAHDALGNVLRAQDRLEDALASYRRAIELDPLQASTLSNIGLCLRNLGRMEDAHHFLETAARLQPEDPVIGTNLAAFLYDVGRFEQANALISTILRRHPDCADAHLVRGTRLLRRGDFAQGWVDYEWRDHDAERRGCVELEYPVWGGDPLSTGHLLVCAEQGLGDQIMFSSCLPDLMRIAPNLLVECDPRLKTLFARSFPQARFYVVRRLREETWLRDGFVPAAKTWIGSLPRWFRQHAADFSNRGCYLTIDSAKAANWKHALERLGPGLKIGISWRGGVATTRRALRSIALPEWAPLLRLPGVHFVSLQYGDCEPEIEDFRRSTGLALAHWPPALRDLDETAALVGALDLVVSVQTTVVHLAGALQKRVLVLVPEVAEWRYGESGARMPWYESAVLIRQQRAGDWSDVIDRAADTVRSML